MTKLYVYLIPFKPSDYLHIQKMMPDPLAVFRAFEYLGKPDPPMIVFAKCLLSVSANSASCKWLFSVFGVTLTKLRNRLQVSLLTFLAELKMHICNGHLHDKMAKSQLKCWFEPPKGPSAVPATPLATTSTTLITADIHPSLPSSSQGAAIIDSATAPAPSGF